MGSKVYDKDTNIKIILDSKYAYVTYNPVLSIGKIEWKGKVSTDDYQDAFIKLLEYVKGKNVKYYLADITKQSVVSPDNRKWFEEYVLPEAVKNGLKKAAVVFDGNIFKKYYLNMILKVTNKYNVPLKTFTKEEDAIEWFLK